MKKFNIILVWILLLVVSCSKEKGKGDVFVDTGYVEFTALDKTYGDYLFLKVLEKDEETNKINSAIGYVITKRQDPGLFKFAKLVFYKKEDGTNAIILKHAYYYANRVNENTLEANLVESMCVDKKTNELNEKFDLLGLDKTNFKMEIESENDVNFEFNGYKIRYARFDTDSIITSFSDDGYELEFGVCSEDESNE